MLTLILIITLSTFCYLKLIKPYNYWKKKGIPYVKPWPVFGNVASTFFRKQSLGDLLLDLYNAFPDQRYIGIYQFLQPTLIIRDLELIKRFTVKEFDTFPDHRAFASGDGDPLASKNLFNLTDATGWRDMRSKLSPAFTSSKMRAMFTLMERCAHQFVDHFEKEETTVTVEVKDAFSRFTNDVIGSTSFGVTCDSLKDPTNTFYTMGRALTSSNVRALKLFAGTFSPTLMKLMKITIFSTKVNEFFRSLVQETLRFREQNRFVRPDMIHLMMEARKGRLKHESPNEDVDSGFAVVHESAIGQAQSRQKAEFTDDDITGQTMLFFYAGFDTASTLMSLTAYELAVNPSIQAKLYQEILAHSKNGISYEDVQGMKYLDCVISEALRKWPPSQVTNRKSIRPFTINPELSGEKPLHLETGSVIWLPVHAIHRNPDNYPEPDKFEPERFSDGNKHKIKPYSYLPFGAGPRGCIGSRFALLEIKLLFVKLLQKFEIVTVEKTPISLKMGKTTFNPLPDGGLWLGFKPKSLKSSLSAK